MKVAVKTLDNSAAGEIDRYAADGRRKGDGVGAAIADDRLGAQDRDGVAAGRQGQRIGADAKRDGRAGLRVGEG